MRKGSIASRFMMLAAFVISAAPAYPQTTPHVEGRRAALGLRLGAGSMAVGSMTNWSTEASVLGRIGIDRRNRFLAMAEFDFFGVGSPVADESFRAANVLMGFNIGNRFKVRPSVGWQFRFWSGSQTVESTDSAPAFGLDLGLELHVSPRLSLSPEASFRYSPIEIEGNVRGRLIGIQLVASW